eukprot:GEMP01019584.1.p1 GENE.GEMP01019584.1~~GEMP01019584.1.p1  ORF type:complete len:708 (+),score=59.74 GEMP01019584.1:73-2124(+)
MADHHSDSSGVDDCNSSALAQMDGKTNPTTSNDETASLGDKTPCQRRTEAFSQLHRAMSSVHEVTCEKERHYRGSNTIRNMMGLVGVTAIYLIMVVISGVFFGITSTGFEESIHLTSHFWRHTLWEELLQEYLPAWWFPCIHMGIGTVASGLFVGYIVSTYIPECAGGGISAVKVCLHLGATVPIHIGVSRFVLTSLYIGCGNPLGSEAPTLHICSIVASSFYNVVARVFGRDIFSEANHRPMVIVGCACGLSAAFNTPMGGILYALEEFGGEHGSTSSHLLSIWIALGSTAALAMHRVLKGNEQFFDVRAEYAQASIAPCMLLAFPLSLICAGIQHVFMLLTLQIRNFRYQHVDERISMGVGSFILTHLIKDQTSPWTPFLFCIGKFFMCSVAVAFNGSGGLFTPSLLLGGGIGVFSSAAFGDDIIIDDSSTTIFAMMCMTGLFSAMLRLPLTGAIISYEMTSHLSTRSDAFLPVVICSLMSYYFADVLSPYDLAERMMLQDGINDEMQIDVPSFSDETPEYLSHRPSLEHSIAAVVPVDYESEIGGVGNLFPSAASIASYALKPRCSLLPNPPNTPKRKESIFSVRSAPPWSERPCDVKDEPPSITITADTKMGGSSQLEPTALSSTSVNKQNRLNHYIGGRRHSSASSNATSMSSRQLQRTALTILGEHGYANPGRQESF